MAAKIFRLRERLERNRSDSSPRSVQIRYLPTSFFAADKAESLERIRASVVRLCQTRRSIRFQIEQLALSVHEASEKGLPPDFLFCFKRVAFALHLLDVLDSVRKTALRSKEPSLLRSAALAQEQLAALLSPGFFGPNPKEEIGPAYERLEPVIASVAARMHVPLQSPEVAARTYKSRVCEEIDRANGLLPDS